MAAVGRILERSRFRRNAGHSARETSLAELGLGQDEAKEQWAAGEVSSEEFLTVRGCEIVDTFPEVPARLLCSERWRAYRWGRREVPEHINLLEARVLVKNL